MEGGWGQGAGRFRVFFGAACIIDLRIQQITYLIVNCRMHVSIFALPEAIQVTDIGDPGIFGVFKLKMSGVLVLVGCCFCVCVFFFGVCVCVCVCVWCFVFRVSISNNAQ